MKPIIVVVDPALGLSKGHHAGIAERIAADRPNRVEIKYYVNQLFNKGEIDLLMGPSISVYPVFSQNFYQYFQTRTNTVFITEYVFTLAKEYMSVIEDIANTGLPHVLIYHTLNWEHANALSLALQMTCTQNSLIEHKVLLMFYPGMNYLGKITDIAISLNFCIALKALQKMENAELMTSCTEYSLAYSRLLGSKTSIKIHPNILAKHSYCKPQRQIVGLNSGNILLYFGDAKVEKGFQKLPERIKWFQQRCTSSARLIIQYSRGVDWTFSSLKDIEKQIEFLANRDSRIELCIGYWSDETLHQYLLNIDLMLLDYDQKAYANKTSGLLWLAVNYNIPILTTENTWIIRESIKIGLTSTTWFKCNTIQSIEARLKESGILNTESEYVKQICMPFWEWIETVKF